MGKSEFTALGAAMARDWLNMQVKIRGMQKASHAFSGLAAVIPPDRDIHMSHGIAYMAGLLGLELEEGHRGDYTYPWEYSFVYGGTRFCQIERERLEGYGEGAGQEIPGGEVPADAGTV